MLVGVVVVLIAATVVITLAVSRGGGGKNQAAPPTPVPTQFGIPSPQPAVSATATQDGVMVLPPPGRIAANGVPLGFPHTPEGAVSAMVRWLPLAVPDNEAREIDVLQTIGSQAYLQTEIPSVQHDYQGQTLPPGAWITFTPIGVKVVSASAGQVTVAILNSVQGGNSQGLQNALIATAADRMVWSGNDWRLDGVGDVPASLKNPKVNDPVEIRADGWEEFQLG
jgi:hypothetical protein